MEGIKAIETVYNGYRFRSRLEARWAVFFDELGIEYQYEPEGVELSDGSYYLPDFYLPDFHCFFEVKRRDIRGTNEGKAAIKKIRDGMWTDSWAGIICFGDPIDNDLSIFCQEINDGGGGGYEGKITIGLHPDMGIPFIFSLNDRRERTFFATFDENIPNFIPMVTKEYGKYEYDDFISNKVMRARSKARQARFEHNERKY